jgi:hypothetical protein
MRQLVGQQHLQASTDRLYGFLLRHKPLSRVYTTETAESIVAWTITMSKRKSSPFTEYLKEAPHAHKIVCGSWKSQ